VFTGPVTLIGGARGVLELVLGAAAAPLTRVRRNAGYENQGFANLMKLWAGEASLTPGDIDAGPKYAFLAIDAQASLWEWMARLGQAAGFPVWMDAEGRLNARAARGQPVATWGWGRDLLGLQAELHDPAITAFAGLPTGKAKEGAWSAGEKPAGGAAAGGGATPGAAGGAGPRRRRGGGRRRNAGRGGRRGWTRRRPGRPDGRRRQARRPGAHHRARLPGARHRQPVRARELSRRARRR